METETLKTSEQSMVNYLSQHREQTPEWLVRYNPFESVPFDVVMSGRVGYYPGACYDLNLIDVAGKAGCAHSFISVDYGADEQKLFDRLHSFGYHLIDRIEWPLEIILPDDPLPKVDYAPRNDPMTFVSKEIKPYLVTEILQKDGDRFAFTGLFADGIATYYRLFVKRLNKAPWIFLLQDHGFGGNYDRFGKGGLLDSYINQSSIRPEFVICADNTPVWDGYAPVDGVSPVTVSHERYLYKKI